ncbi:LysR family transcriptional regulator [Lichenicoccus sp.]|uniref:LysR family transcriptional regulator n=1 Tax=Lichenicoccus sp. TaxID=2781899 RepID=UPI003D10953D
MGSSLRRARLPVTISDVETFLAVADLGSFSRAAEQLNVTQPAVTARIARLEAILGVSLIRRTSRRLSLTRQGERLRFGGERVMVEWHMLLDAFQPRGSRAAAVVVACTGGVAALFMPDLLRAFAGEHTGIEIRLRDLAPPKALEAVRQGKADLAIMAAGGQSEGLRFTPLVEDHCVVVAPLGHPVLGRATTTLAEVLRHPILMADQQVTLRRTIETLAEARGLSLRLADEGRNASSVFGLFSMVAAGFGLMLQPKSLVRLSLAIPLSTVSISDARIEHAYGLVTPESGTCAQAVQTFAAFAALYARKQVNGADP